MQIWHMKRSISRASLTATSVMFGKARMVAMSSIARWVGPSGAWPRPPQCVALRAPGSGWLLTASTHSHNGYLQTWL